MRIRALLVVILVLFLHLSNAESQAPGIDWSRKYGAAESDGAAGVLVNSEGNIVVSGHRTPSGENSPYGWLLCLDTSGGIVWQHMYGNNDTSDYLVSVCSTSDGGYALCGYSWSYATTFDIWVVKVDSTGVFEWDFLYGDAGQDYGSAIQQTAEGGYIIAGSYGSGDAHMMKLDATGGFEWIQYYDNGSYNYANDVLVTSDGGYIFCGSTNFSSAWLVKTDSMGEIEWQNTYGTDFSGAYSILQAADGGFILCGYHGQNNARRLYMAKTDSLGEMEWSRLHGTGGEIGRDIQQTPDGGYVAAGSRSGDFYLVRTNADGLMIWDTTFDNGDGETCKAIAVTSDDEYVLCGETLEEPGPPYTYPDAWIVKTEMCMGLPGRESPLNGIAGCSVYPNPFSGFTSIGFTLDSPADIEMTVYELTGRAVSTLVNGQLPGGPVSVFWNGRDQFGNALPCGVYLLMLTDGITCVTREMVMIR